MALMIVTSSTVQVITFNVFVVIYVDKQAKIFLQRKYKLK